MRPFDPDVQPTGRYLSFAEREEIALLKAQDKGVREIARAIGRDPGTISRELRRNAATRGGKLRVPGVGRAVEGRPGRTRPKTAKLVANPRLRAYVQERLSGQISRPDGTHVAGPRPPAVERAEQAAPQGPARGSPAWSPEQIANRLKVDFPDDESMRISHEAIYQALYIEGRGALKRELVSCLRTGRALRRPARAVAAQDLGARHPRGADQRAARRGRGPRRSRALGGRPDDRAGAFRDRHGRRAQQPVHDAGPPAPRGGLPAQGRRRRTGRRWPATARSR